MKEAIKQLVEKCAEYEAIYLEHPEFAKYLDIAKENILGMVEELGKKEYELRAYSYAIQYHAYLMGFTACLEANGFLDDLDEDEE